MEEIRNINLADMLEGKKCINFFLEDLKTWFGQFGSKVCCSNFYQLLVLEEGKADITLDFVDGLLEAPAAAVIFPQQLSRVELSDDTVGRLVAFDDMVFCSDILATELKVYNIGIHHKLNNVSFVGSDDEFSAVVDILDNIASVYSSDINMVRKMQIKFMIKVLIFKLLDKAPSIEVSSASDRDISYYADFRKMVDENFMTERKLGFYCDKLGISSKKLTSLCSQYGDISPLGIIHERLELEIKKCFITESLTLKEMAFKFGFSSQSALNKFIDTKFGMTPTSFKEYLMHVAAGKY